MRSARQIAMVAVIPPRGDAVRRWRACQRRREARDSDADCGGDASHRRLSRPRSQTLPAVGVGPAEARAQATAPGAVTVFARCGARL